MTHQFTPELRLIKPLHILDESLPFLSNKSYLRNYSTSLDSYKRQSGPLYSFKEEKSYGNYKLFKFFYNHLSTQHCYVSPENSWKLFWPSQGLKALISGKGSARNKNLP